MAGEEKLWIRGVTYGTFAAGAEGEQFGSLESVEHDFATMASNGVNCVRTYTVPPRWVLDTALRHELRVMVGLPWEQHITFLDNRKRARSIERSVRAGVARCAGHPAVLAYAVGNEIPASVVRWHGRKAVERFIERLYRAAKEEDPGALVTYVNFPSTEYLQLPFLDFACFNVYLESKERFDAYLARLQNVAGEKPLVMAEIGLDSRRQGEEEQAHALDWQVRSAYAAGCAGAFVFAWTDEWNRGGHEVEDWDFGLTRRDRRPKLALWTVRRAFAEVPFPVGEERPKVSVVVCTYNGARTLPGCLAGLARLRYPDFEVIVVDDGSTDGSSEIAEAYDARVIRTPNRGLSAARNTGAEAAAGEIVAYLDDDASPDPDWLSYLATTFITTDHVGVGGPNLAPDDDAATAACVANAPGGPVHVLLSDTVAEHIPGCNMAYRRDSLLEAGGFDPQFRVAGDDVDVCWKLQQGGGTLGFHAGAMVWHHRRGTLARFWAQQRGYGKAEALLERKWPAKYNRPGHLTWSGRIYGRGIATGFRRWRVYYGTWGTSAFQPGYEKGPDLLTAVAGSPEWYLVILGLAGASGLGLLWSPLMVALPLLVVAVAALLCRSLAGARQAEFGMAGATPRRRLALRSLTAFLYLAQPAARLSGRVSAGLAPWRRPNMPSVATPRRRRESVWFQSWSSLESRVERIEDSLRATGGQVRRGGEFDRWDLEISAGAIGSARMRSVIEEHGSGCQMMHSQVWPRVPRFAVVGAGALTALAVAAAADGAAVAVSVLGVLLAALVVAGVRECGSATAAAVSVVRSTADEGRDPEPAPTVITMPRPAPRAPAQPAQGSPPGEREAALVLARAEE